MRTYVRTSMYVYSLLPVMKWFDFSSPQRYNNETCITSPRTLASLFQLDDRDSMNRCSRRLERELKFMTRKNNFEKMWTRFSAYTPILVKRNIDSVVLYLTQHFSPSTQGLYVHYFTYPEGARNASRGCKTNINATFLGKCIDYSKT